jgi:cytidylate kinase
MSRSYDYPENELTRIDQLQLPPFDPGIISHLPQKYLINVYGLVGVGKGTISKQIAQKLDIPHIDTGLIHRSITYAYLDQGLECTPERTDAIIAELDITLDKEDGLIILYRGKHLTIPILREPRISAKVADYASIDHQQLASFKKLTEIITHYGSPVVLDGRGGHPPHVVQTESQGYEIVRILLEITDEVNIERYIAAFVQKQQQKDPGFVLTDSHKHDLREEFKITVLERNRKDLIFIDRLGLGASTPGSGILDTSELTIEEVTNYCLSYIVDMLTKTE